MFSSESCWVENGERIINDRYPELVQEETINKVNFVYVLEEEHKRVGYSYHWITIHALLQLFKYSLI
jgi:hypothetical protein